MTHLTDSKFSFQSSGLPEDTFDVVRFRGSEGLNRCYSFEVLLVSDNPEVDFPAVIQHSATLTLHREQGDHVHYHGILLGFEQLHAFGRAVFYRAILVPRLHWLSLTRHNQVFLNKTVPEFIEACLIDGGLSGLDFEFRLEKKDYEPLEYVCQYGETHLDFVTRWLEREGMYYFFEQTENGEKVIITDAWISHTAMPQGKAVRYSPPSGLETLHMQEIVSSFTCRYSLTPMSVLVKDYNYLKPSLEVSGTAEVDPQGQGTFYSYGDHILTPEDGNRVAKVYAESVLCRREVYYGEGSIPYCSPGFVFDLKDHYRRSFNRGYLTLDVDHEGSQTGHLVDGLTRDGERREVYYRNSFTAIPDTVQFRAQRITHRPKISGCISAKVDAETSGEYAELDGHGRYKVVLPFDNSGRKEGKASSWLRMAQPYAGSDHGMHFPLHKGTEVLLNFIDGDPDRPIIQGAVPNPETPSMVSQGNSTNAGFRTAGGNQISFQDEEGSRRISLSAGDGKSRIILGSGSPSQNLSESDYDTHFSDFYTCYGDMGAALASSFAFNATSNFFLPKFGKNLIERISHNISERDKLGNTMAGKNQFNPWPLALNLSSVFLSNLLNAYILRKLGQRIRHQAISEHEFGVAFKEFWKDWEKKTWYAKTGSVLFSAPKDFLKTFVIGSAGTYGAVLFAHAPSDSYMMNVVNPKSASMLNLSNGNPNVLVAASNGSVDIVGEKGIYFISEKLVDIETDQAAFHTKSSLHLVADDSIMKLDKNRIDIEKGGARIRLDPNMLDLQSLEDDAGINVDTGNASLVMTNNPGEISLGVKPGLLSEMTAKIEMKQQDNSILMDSDGPMTIHSKDALSIDANKKKVSVAGKDATELVLGNDNSKITLKGNNVKISAFNVVRIG